MKHCLPTIMNTNLLVFLANRDETLLTHNYEYESIGIFDIES